MMDHNTDYGMSKYCTMMLGCICMSILNFICLFRKISLKMSKWIILLEMTKYEVINNKKD